VCLHAVEKFWHSVDLYFTIFAHRYIISLFWQELFQEYYSNQLKRSHVFQTSHKRFKQHQQLFPAERNMGTFKRVQYTFWAYALRLALSSLRIVIFQATIDRWSHKFNAYTRQTVLHLPTRTQSCDLPWLATCILFALENVSVRRVTVGKQVEAYTIHYEPEHL